jgi:hypothetical protein
MIQIRPDGGGYSAPEVRKGSRAAPPAAIPAANDGKPQDTHRASAQISVASSDVSASITRAISTKAYRGLPYGSGSD